MGDDGEGTDPVPPTEGTGTREADGTLLSAAALRQITDAFTAALRSGGPSTLREPPVAPSEGHSSGGKLLAHYYTHARDHTPAPFRSGSFVCSPCQSLVSGDGSPSQREGTSSTWDIGPGIRTAQGVWARSSQMGCPCGGRELC